MMRPRLITLLVALLGIASLAQGHPVSLTTALVNVEPGRMVVELEVMAEDLIFYYELEHDEELYFPREALKVRAREHEAFLREHLHLRDGDGRRFAGRLLDIDTAELDDLERGIHIDDLMAYNITYRFAYALDDEPAFLTVTQDLGGPEPPVPAEMDVWVFQHGLRVGPIVTLSHRTAHTFELDWELDPAEIEQDIDAARQRLAERRDEDLGIASYSRVYSYLYITDTEVRHELLIPALTLERWIDLERGDEAFIDVEEQRHAGEALLAWLEERSEVRIDGEAVAPRLTRAEFFGPGVRDFGQRAEPRRLSIYNARAGVILTYPAPATPAPPREVELTWEHFDEQLPALRPRVYAFEDESDDVLLMPRRNRYHWRRDGERPAIDLASLPAPEPAPRLSLPVVSLVAAGATLAMLVIAGVAGPRRRRICLVSAAVLLLVAAVAFPHARLQTPHPLKSAPAPAADEAREIFQALHRNVYRAFEQRDERRSYDLLAHSVAGRLLEDLYLEIRRGLTMQEQGGAVSRVDAVELVDGRREPVAGRRQGFTYRCTWTVTGSVEHWGHVHSRTNRYEAIFRVEAVDDGWRITDFEPLQEQRVAVRTRLRQ